MERGIRIGTAHAIMTLLLGTSTASIDQPTDSPFHTSKPKSSEVTPTAAETRPEPGTSSLFDSSKGYLHGPSNVGFVYPADWIRSDVTNLGRTTALDMKTPDGDLHVTLYWTELESCTKPAPVERQELGGLRQLYADRVGDPEPIFIAGQSGFKIPIVPGLSGLIHDPDLFGMVYIFAVHCDTQAWKIKLRATVRGKENLPTIETLLKNYRVY